jgi:uncharacterized protein
MHVEVRLYAALADLAGAAHVHVPVGAPRSVKDLVEAVGVPHPEVSLIVVDGSPVGFDHQVAGGERVAVYPPFRQLDLTGVTTVAPGPRPPRFVLDVHLGTLTRRLRTLGFDCWYRSDADDVELATVAVDEERILLTRDRGLLMRREITHGYCPRSDDPELQLLEVVDRYGLAPRARPFSRCVRCNGELAHAEPHEVHAEIPPRIRREHDTFTRCRDCRRVYWPGSHRSAMATWVDEVVDDLTHARMDDGMGRSAADPP